MNHIMRKADFIKIRNDGKIKSFGEIAPYGNREQLFLSKFGCYVGVTDSVSELTVILKNISHGEKRNNVVGILVPNTDFLNKAVCAKFTRIDAPFFKVYDLKNNTKELKTVE